jgi:AraC-like DNA-binding protein
MAYEHDGLLQLLEQVVQVEPSVSLKCAATRLGVHRHTAAHIVKRLGYRGFREWRDEYTLKRALQILRTEPTRSVKQIACSLGFGSGRSFDRWFRRHMMTTPTAWRARRQIENQVYKK